MSDDQVLKAEKDYTKETDECIEKSNALAKTDLRGAIDQLMVLEKQTRQASDLASTTRILIAIVTLCKNSGNWTMMTEYVQGLSKKHGQLKMAITKLVRTVIEFLDDAPNPNVKLAVITVLRTVTEGKIYVEVERARVTRILSNMRLEKGDLPGATEVLCELQVETFGSMERREKTDFILEQVNLCIRNGDWNQASSLSRKINPKYFTRPPKRTAEEKEKERKEREEKNKNRSVDDPVIEPEDDVSDLKLRYYDQQIRLAKHDGRYLDACKYYRQVADTEVIEEDPEKLRASLCRSIYFIILAKHDNEQSDLLHRIHADGRSSQLTEEARLLELFTKAELMRWSDVEGRFGKHLLSTDIFSSTRNEDDPEALVRWEDLKKRVTEHNVRVVAKYYTRVTLVRLQQLLGLGEAEAEQYISDLVTSKMIYARIDRPAGIVNFGRARDVDDLLNEWGSDVRALLTQLERVDHLITKEEMMATIPVGDKAAGQDL